MEIKTISDFRAAMRHGPYTSIGCYPVFFATSDGAVLSFASAKAERRNIIEALRDNAKSSGWHIFAMDVNWEDADLLCDHSGEPIESAYA